MSGPLRLSVVLPLGGELPRLLETAIAMERAGVDVLAVPEAYSMDCVSLLGFLAAHTSRVELASQILPIYSRTPALLAMTAAGLDRVSQGRFRLGLGASGPQVIEGWHGVRFDRSPARTREIVAVCRRVWRREPLSHDGDLYPLPLPKGRGGSGLGKPLTLIERPVRDRIPIYLAALGPRSVELTAEIAEGWIPFVYVPELADRVWAEPLARGRERRDPALGPLQVSAGGPFAITDAPWPLRDLGRERLALYVGGMGARGANYYHAVASAYGFADEADRVQELYLAGRKPEAAAAVPAGLLEGTSLIGDEDYLRARLRAYVDAGVTTLQIDPVGPRPLADIARLRELVDAL
ncbi:LLM class F420-dependent oxidoreductase [Streptosporangium sp. NBC_01755]|nr:MULTISPECIES: LLM class F420-dependent oxidoreductase [unclassified Streptosporangium]WSA26757.1 LLM class F420-dependent oxidoreductase [Streptosporangium sp. NBC_01810]WSD01818.1 LLM class F420-dependent oxidoreductase [Streptosporangium sp. NBC_01755]